MYLGINGSTWVMGIQGSAWSTTTATVTAGQWAHIVVVMDGAIAKMYVDGIYNSQKSYTSFTFSDDFRIGSRADYAMNGNIDDVRIYATVLSQADITDLYETRMEIEEAGTLYAKDFNAPINYLNPERFFTYDNSGTDDPGYQTYDGKSV